MIAAELSKMLNVPESHAYKIIWSMNTEIRKAGCNGIAVQLCH
jgi:hypothetical protein